MIKNISDNNKDKVKAWSNQGNSHNNKILQYGAYALLIALCLHPEVLFAQGAVSLDTQLDKVSLITTGKLKTFLISATTIGAATVSILKSSPLLACTIIAIGAALAYYLEWIAGGMKLGLIEHLSMLV